MNDAEWIAEAEWLEKCYVCGKLSAKYALVPVKGHPGKFVHGTTTDCWPEHERRVAAGAV